ncbi:MAG: ferrochelatase [Myxococcales bacterium]|nr:ferrochelatase [Myxococcales bacterium]MCB9734217.1 ferrochelatase [Deltaproteobacteria bacterium]
MKGLLLVNLGTPDAPRAPEVRRYLAEFLSDPRVIDINPVARWLLLHAIILRVRPAKSAAAYQKVWTEAGSPLLVHSRALAAAVADRLGAGWHVELAMRYGKPDLASALDRFALAGVTQIVLLPLYPQYASSSTGSSVARVYELVQERAAVPAITTCGDFYDDPGFLDAVVAVTRPILDAGAFDHVLMSFHGLPERHVKATDPTGAHCLASPSCCDRIVPANASCYRAQSFATARGLAERLGLPADRTSVAFQSRLGRTPWIRPFTDERVIELAQAGVKRLAVLCPSFVADCLETVEEIGLRARESFLAAGGEELVAIPCVNGTPAWVDAVVAMARRAGPP